MTLWNTEDIEAAKLKGQEIVEAVLLEIQREDDLINAQKVDEVLNPVFAPAVVSDSSTLAVKPGVYESLTFISYVLFS